jgi:hypothetical protein
VTRVCDSIQLPKEIKTEDKEKKIKRKIARDEMCPLCQNKAPLTSPTTTAQHQAINSPLRLGGEGRKVSSEERILSSSRKIGY